jgi:GH15 family glucan-1,4-alpha-glucosidase
MGRRRLAEEGFKKYTALDGFYEWYDPSTGKGYGAKDQLWSAALYLRAAKAYGLELPTIEL